MEAQSVRLADFLDEYREQISRSVIENYPPLYDFSDRQRHVEALRGLKRKPYMAQLDALCALAKLFETEDSAVMVGEMGVGKTIVSIICAYICGFKKVLVMCPPHLVGKWEREVMITLPEGSVVCHHLRRFPDMDRTAGLAADGKYHFFIVGRERAKLSYQWEPAGVVRRMLVGEENRKVAEYIACPECGAMALDSEGIPLTFDDIGKKKTNCSKCKGPLWQAKRDGPRRYAIAEYIKRRYKGYFDLYIADECHELKGKGTAQGFSAGILATACRKSLGMTGTLFGGYSSTLFHLLYRLTSRFKDDYGHSQVSRWIDHFGIWERVSKYETDEYGDNIMSRGKKYVYAPREKPGISPVVLPRYLLDKTVFIRLSDIAIDLPSLEEEIVDLGMTEVQAEAYWGFFNQLRAALLKELQKGSKSLLAIYLQALLTYPDRCTIEETVYNKQGDEVAYAPALDADVLYPKEEKLVEIIKTEKRAGRRVLVYCTHTERRDVTERLKEELTEAGVKTEILRASVASEKREKWIEDHASRIDCLIANPKLVQTGLDLVQFPTMVFFEVEYSVYTLRQASRRSWRIGQNLPVKIYYMLYGGTMQEQALKLVALKTKTSLAIEGDLGDEGLATYNVAEDNLYYELARNIANNVTIDESIDSIWHKVQEQEKEQGGSDLLMESLDGYSDMPDLNSVLKRSVSEIRQKFNPELWDKLYKMRMEEKAKRVRRRKINEDQLELFVDAG